MLYRDARTGRQLVALAALAVVRFVWVSTNHKHLADEADDCPICAAVVHAVSNSVLAGTVPVTCYVLLYGIQRAQPVLRHYAAVVLFPCICGPPTRTS